MGPAVQADPVVAHRERPPSPPRSPSRYRRISWMRQIPSSGLGRARWQPHCLLTPRAFRIESVQVANVPAGIEPDIRPAAGCRKILLPLGVSIQITAIGGRKFGMLRLYSRGVYALCQVVGRDGPAVDRKSTRLNSSHGYISYAVFCLKKKNKKRTSK